MNKTQLQKIGQALYGERWKQNLANDIGVSLRTIGYWLNGAKISEDKARTIASLADRRIKEIIRAKKEVFGA